ncbi:ATP-dependent metallopeptidase FtsH/Yme1/Tma family protein, partial [Deinococcus sonorensis]
MTGQPPKRNNWLWWLLGGVVVLVATISFVLPRSSQDEISLADFGTALSRGQVQRVVILYQDNIASLSGLLSDGRAFETRTLSTDPLIGFPALQARGVDVSLAQPSRLNWVAVLSTVLTGALIVVLLVVLLRGNRQSGSDGASQFGRSKATVHAEGQVKVTFAEVAGCDEAKQDLAEVVDFL